MKFRALLALVVMSSVALAAPPKLELPPKVEGKSGTFILIPAQTEGKVVQWVSLDPKLSIIPPELLKDSKTAVAMAPKGVFKVLAYTALADEPSVPTITKVYVDGATDGDTTPPVTPPVTPPTQPPVTPPAPAGQLWGVIVQPEGPLTAALADHRKNDVWNRVRAKGITLSWIEPSQIDQTWAPELQGLTLPALIVIRVKDGKSTVLTKQGLPPVDQVEKTFADAVK